MKIFKYIGPGNRDIIFEGPEASLRLDMGDIELVVQRFGVNQQLLVQLNPTGDTQEMDIRQVMGNPTQVSILVEAKPWGDPA